MSGEHQNMSVYKIYSGYSVCDETIYNLRTLAIFFQRYHNSMFLIKSPKFFDGIRGPVTFCPFDWHGTLMLCHWLAHVMTTMIRRTAGGVHELSQTLQLLLVVQILSYFFILHYLYNIPVRNNSICLLMINFCVHYGQGSGFPHDVSKSV